MAFSYGLEVDTMKLTVGQDARLVKKYHRVYLANSDVEMTLDEVAAAIGILPGSGHIDWSFATCNEIGVDRLTSREPFCWWRVTYDWATNAVVPEDNADTSPTLRRVMRSTNNTQQQRFIIKDKNGVLITDAAGSPFDGGVPVTDYMGSMVFERDEDHDASKMSQAVLLTGKLNSVTFMGCAPGTLMLEVVGKEKWEGDYHFWTFTYTMHYDKDGHQPHPLNAGLYQKVGTQRVRILEDDGKPSQEPQPLTAFSGTVVPVANRPALCNFITVDHYNSFDFASLGLPTT